MLWAAVKFTIWPVYELTDLYLIYRSAVFSIAGVNTERSLHRKNHRIPDPETYLASAIHAVGQCSEGILLQITMLVPSDIFHYPPVSSLIFGYLRLSPGFKDTARYPQITTPRQISSNISGRWKFAPRSCHRSMPRRCQKLSSYLSDLSICR